MSKDNLNVEFISKEGLELLEKELKELVTVKKPQVAKDVKAAREFGDLSENADYDAAREEQAIVEARISEIEDILKNAQVIKESKRGSKIAKLGSTVTILDLESNEESTFSILGRADSDPNNGKLSYVTPLAKAMIDKKVGDIATVEIANPYDIKILKIK